MNNLGHDSSYPEKNDNGLKIDHNIREGIHVIAGVAGARREWQIYTRTLSLKAREGGKDDDNIPMHVKG